MLRRPLNSGSMDDAGDAERNNYNKLVSIQDQLVSGQVFGAVYPAMLDLASRHRVFIKEIDLKKVCRKSNKIFHFWLFNDCMIYGCLLQSGQYLFHRKIDLATCTILVYNSLVYKHALEISGSDKSFIVMAANEYEQMQWVTHVLAAIVDFKEQRVTAVDPNTAAYSARPRPTMKETSSSFWDNNSDVGTPTGSRCSDQYSEHSQVNISEPRFGINGRMNFDNKSSCAICAEVFSISNRRYECCHCTRDVCLQHSMQKVSAAYQRQGKTEECYRTCQSCLMDKKSVNFDEGDPRMGGNCAGEPVRLTAAAISDAHANSVRKMYQVVPSNGKGPPKAPKPSPPPKPARPALQTSPQPSTTVQPSSPQPSLKTASPIQRPPRLDLKSNALDEKSVVMPPPHVPIHATAKSDNLERNVKQAGVEYSRSPQQSGERVKGMDVSEATDERTQSYDRVPRSEGNSPTNCGKKPFRSSHASCPNESQEHHTKKSDPTNTLKKMESSTRFPSESSENKNAGKEQSNLSGTSSTHVSIASQLFREKVEAMNKKISAPSPTPIPVSHPKKLTVQDVPLPYTPECNVVFGIPDEVKAFTKENPLPDTLSSQPMSVIRAGSPLKSIIPASSNHHHMTATIETSSSTPSRGGSVGGGVSTCGGLPVHADTALQLQHSSIRVPPSPSHSPKASASPSHSLSKMKPSPSTSTVRAPPVGKSSSASSLLTGPERLSSAPHTSSDIKDQHTQGSKITTLSHSKVDNSVKKVSSLHINDYITTQAKPPSSHLNVRTTNYTETKNDMDSGSMESFSSRTTIESKVSTSTVTYEYECDIDDDDENQDDDISAIQDDTKNKTQQSRQKRPERFCEKDVRKKMEEDGVPPDVMFEFLKTLGTASSDTDCGQIHRDIPAVKPGKTRQSSAPSLTQVPHPKEMKKEKEPFIPPPPMTPPQSPKGRDTSSSKYAAYIKMRAMRIPDGAVRQKMATDGISHREIDAYFNDNGEHKVEVEVQHRVSPPPPPPPPPPHMMPPPSTATPVGKGAGGGSVLSTTPPPPPGAVRITPDQSPSRGSEGIIHLVAPSGFSEFPLDLVNQLPVKEPTAPVQTERAPINPASSVFASIRSGVTLKNISSTEVEFESVRKPTPPLTKKPSSMHDILISALSSRRLCSNMENLKTVSSDASDNEFDPFE